MPERVLDPDTECGKEHRAGQPLLVHDLQPEVAVLILGTQRLELPEGLGDLLTPRIASIPVVEGTGFGHGVEGRVGHIGVDGPADEQAPPAVDVGPTHPTVPQRRVLMAGERVGSLVVVVVEVEDPGRHRLIARMHVPSSR